MKSGTGERTDKHIYLKEDAPVSSTANDLRWRMQYDVSKLNSMIRLDGIRGWVEWRDLWRMSRGHCTDCVYSFRCVRVNVAYRDGALYFVD